MDVKHYAEKFASLFPESTETYHIHLVEYGELLGHVLFCDLINQPLTLLLKDNKEVERIKKFIALIEDMYENGDDAVQNIVVVTILEYLGDDNDVLKNAYSYFSEALIAASKEAEHFLGRREVKISHKKGKVLASW